MIPEFEVVSIYRLLGIFSTFIYIVNYTLWHRLLGPFLELEDTSGVDAEYFLRPIDVTCRYQVNIFICVGYNGVG